MRSPIRVYLNRRVWGYVAIAIACMSAAVLIAMWPRLQRWYAAEMIVRAVTADYKEDPDLEGSVLLWSAIERVEKYRAHDEAIAALLPLLDVSDSHSFMRATYCMWGLKTLSPAAISALIGIYSNPHAPAHTRVDVAGILTMLAPRSAEDCGAARTWRRYLARHPNLGAGDEEDLLIDEADAEKPENQAIEHGERNRGTTKGDRSI